MNKFDSISIKGNIINQLSTTLEDKPDDLFITCASFEARSLGIFAKNFAKNYRSRWACIFKHEPDINEDSKFEKDRLSNYNCLKSYLSSMINGNISSIICSRMNVFDGMNQFSALWETYWKPKGCNVITIDITTFTKLYLLEILHFLVVKNGIKSIRIIYNQARSYGSSLLTKGVGQVICFPSYPGKFITNKDTILIACLGFETERAIGIWNACEPNRTIAVIGKPPLKQNYVERAIDANKFLLTRAGVEIKYADYYDPFSMMNTLEDIYINECLDEKRNPQNIVIMSLGTKIQTLGAFLFWLNHQNIRLMYAFPHSYGDAYHSREPGKNYEFDISF